MSPFIIIEYYINFVSRYIIRILKLIWNSSLQNSKWLSDSRNSKLFKYNFSHFIFYILTLSQKAIKRILPNMITFLLRNKNFFNSRPNYHIKEIYRCCPLLFGTKGSSVYFADYIHYKHKCFLGSSDT